MQRLKQAKVEHGKKENRSQVQATCLTNEKCLEKSMEQQASHLLVEVFCFNLTYVSFVYSKESFT